MKTHIKDACMVTCDGLVHTRKNRGIVAWNLKKVEGKHRHSRPKVNKAKVKAARIAAKISRRKNRK